MNKTFHGTQEIRPFAFYFRSETACPVRTVYGTNAISTKAVCDRLARRISTKKTCVLTTLPHHPSPSRVVKVTVAVNIFRISK